MMRHRYVMTISVNDAFSQAWLNCFDDVGRMIMGMSADELEALRVCMIGDPLGPKLRANFRIFPPIVGQRGEEQ